MEGGFGRRRSGSGGAGVGGRSGAGRGGREREPRVDARLAGAGGGAGRGGTPRPAASSRGKGRGGKRVPAAARTARGSRRGGGRGVFAVAERRGWSGRFHPPRGARVSPGAASSGFDVRSHPAWAFAVNRKRGNTSRFDGASWVAADFGSTWSGSPCGGQLHACRFEPRCGCRRPCI